MPMGSTRVDVNITGINFRLGNPIPPLESDFNSNPVPPDENYDNSNPVPIDPSFDSNVVNWQPSSSHFGNNVNLTNGN